jgi:hypothetical protein
LLRGQLILYCVAVTKAKALTSNRMSTETPYEIIGIARNSHTFDKHEYISFSGVYFEIYSTSSFQWENKPFGIIFLADRKFTKDLNGMFCYSKLRLYVFVIYRQ